MPTSKAKATAKDQPMLRITTEGGETQIPLTPDLLAEVQETVRVWIEQGRVPEAG